MRDEGRRNCGLVLLNICRNFHGLCNDLAVRKNSVVVVVEVVVVYFFVVVEFLIVSTDGDIGRAGPLTQKRPIGIGMLDYFLQ